MAGEIIKIQIEQEHDGWHVVAYCNNVIIESSPAIPDQLAARNAAKEVARRLEHKFGSKFKP